MEWELDILPSLELIVLTWSTIEKGREFEDRFML